MAQHSSVGTLKKVIWSVFVAGLIAVLVYLVVDIWQTNQRVKEDLGQPVIVNDADPKSRQDAEGRDEEEVKPSAIDSYKVAGDLPRTIKVDDINLYARVLPMGVNADSSMQAPINIFDSGWYSASSKPGEDGAMVIDGHASGPSRQGLFAYIDTLKKGQKIEVERGDGKVFTYEVVALETVSVDDIDMAKVLSTYGDSEQGLNLITCAGTWIRESGSFTDRAVVYAIRV